jgi:hypothetical protein
MPFSTKKPNPNPNWTPKHPKLIETNPQIKNLNYPNYPNSWPRNRSPEFQTSNPSANTNRRQNQNNPTQNNLTSKQPNPIKPNPTQPNPKQPGLPTQPDNLNAKHQTHCQPNPEQPLNSSN